MTSRVTLSIIVACIAIVAPTALLGQDDQAAAADSTTPPPLTMLYGRVQDSDTGQPVVDAVVSTGDVFGAVTTDSTGSFGIQVYGPPPYRLLTEAIGYEAAEYQLAEDATARISVLVLDRGPIPLEGISVVAQARVSGVLQGLTQRRGGYSGSVRFYDRDRLDGIRGRDAFQLVLQTVSGARECEAMFPLYPVSDRICRRARNRAPSSGPTGLQVGDDGVPLSALVSGQVGGGNDDGFSSGDQLVPIYQNPVDAANSTGALAGGNGGDLAAGAEEIVVCVNGRRAYSHDGALSAIPLEEIAIYEIYGPPLASVVQFAPPAGHVRIYTRIWLLTQASRAVLNFPAEWGC